MISVDNLTPLRIWQFGAEDLVDIDSIRKYLNCIIESTEAHFELFDSVVEANSLGNPELNCIYINSLDSMSYMSVYVVTVLFENGPSVLMGVTGKGEQIKADDLHKYYLETRGTWANVKDEYQEMKSSVTRVSRRLGNSGAAATIATGAGYLAGKAIGGGVRLAVKGIKALTRDQAAYEKELRYYLDVMALGDYAFAGVGANNYFERIKAGAEKGILAAQYLLGTRYCEGIGVDEDRSEGIRWFEIAAERGHSDSREILAFEYFFGDETYSAEQKSKGLEYLDELIQKGDDGAVEAMIEITTNPSKYGVKLSPEQRMGFLSDAANSGFIGAIYNLANIYDSQVESDLELASYTDDSAACELYELLLSSGSDYNAEEVAYRLGVMNNTGRGTPQDPEKACQYFERAGENNDARISLLKLYATDPATKDYLAARRIRKELQKVNDPEITALCDYYGFLIADAEEQYKESMSCAQKYIDNTAGKESIKEELQKYLQEKNDILSRMSEEERREYLKEPKSISDRLNLDANGKKVFLAILIVALLIIIGVVIMTRPPADHAASNSDDYNESEPIQSEEQTAALDESEPAQSDEQIAVSDESQSTPDISLGPAFDCIGKTYEEIEQEWGPFYESMPATDGVSYDTADGRCFVFSWTEADSESPIESAPCIVFASFHPEDVFDVPEDVSLQELAEAVGEELDMERIYANAQSDLDSILVWLIEYNGEKYEVVVDYDENIEIESMSLFLYRP